MDNKPVHLFFLILAPEKSTVTHLKVLSGISRLLKDKAFRENLQKAGDREEIYSTIVEEDDKVFKGAVL